MNTVFIIGLISVVVWIVSLIARKKNEKVGIILSWSSILIIVIAIILYYATK